MKNIEEYIDKVGKYEKLLVAFSEGEISLDGFGKQYRALYKQDDVSWEETEFSGLREVKIQLDFVAGEPCPWGEPPMNEDELKILVKDKLSAIQEEYYEQDLRSWVLNNLFSNDIDGSLFEIYEDFESRKSKFGIETVLYSVKLSDSFILAIIEGTIPPAEFKYRDLMSSICKASSEEKCYWVYITEPDNCIAVLEEARLHYWGKEYSQDYQLQSFEKKPAAEGGCSYMCLIPESKSWILVHEMNPLNDFTIAIHSNEKFREDVLTSLSVSEVDNARD